MLSKKAANLKEIKYLGGIGMILFLIFNMLGSLIFNFKIFKNFSIALISFHIYSLILVFSLILVLVGISKLASIFKNKKIFDYFLIDFFIVILPYIFAEILLFALWIAKKGYFGEAVKDSILGFIFSWGLWIILLFFLLMYPLSILGKYFLKKSFKIIAERTKVDLFNTAGNFHFISAILYIVLVGFLLEDIAYVLTIIAFFSLPDKISIENK